MSHHCHLDLRAATAREVQSIIKMAEQRLGAHKSTISCGQADIKSTRIDVDMDAVRRAQGESTMVVNDSGGLQQQLSSSLAQSLNAAKPLGSFQPIVADVHVGDTIGSEEGRSGLRLVEDLECSALDGARLMIFEQEDPLGGEPTYLIGLDEVLFAADGAWKDESQRAMYETFLGQVTSARDLALEEADQPMTPEQAHTALGAALALEGLGEVSSKTLPTGATHRVFSTEEASATTAPPRKRTVGE